MSNDRLKFRAWYSEEKKMEYQEGKTPAWLGDILTNSYYIPMQCTGVKDKNGKLIYEGDIVTNNYNSAQNSPIYWNQDMCAFAWEGGDEWGIIEDELIILGNIYENDET